MCLAHDVFNPTRCVGNANRHYSHRFMLRTVPYEIIFYIALCSNRLYSVIFYAGLWMLHLCLCGRVFFDKYTLCCYAYWPFACVWAGRVVWRGAVSGWSVWGLLGRWSKNWQWCLQGSCSWSQGRLHWTPCHLRTRIQCTICLLVMSLTCYLTVMNIVDRKCV